MSLVYRTTGAWGSGKGSELTWAELDGNFYTLQTEINTLTAAIPAAAKGITSIAAVGSNMVITYTDLSTQTVPMYALTYPFKGAWLPLTGYSVRDRLTNNGSLYEVLVSHTSASSFDPHATDGLGSDLYGLLMANPGASFPTGGSTDMILGKVDGTDFNVSWRASGLPRAGTIHQILMKNSSSDWDASWHTVTDAFNPTIDTLANVAITSKTRNDILVWDGTNWVNKQGREATSKVSGVTSYTPSITDNCAFVTLTSATTCQVTIPAEASVAFPIDAEISFFNKGGATVTFVPDTGVTLHLPDTFQAQLLGRYSVCTVKKIASDEWTLFGLLAAA